MKLKLVRTPGIYLVGFMGSGKSTVGKLLAERLGWTFVDLDEEIEEEQKTPIPEIFEKQGEEWFRELETEAIRKRVRMVRSGCPTVLALGGGAFVRDENFEMLADHGVTVWLDCPVDLAWDRVSVCGNDRPLARDRGKFRELFEARRQSYARAEYRVDVSADAEAVVDAICALPLF